MSFDLASLVAQEARRAGERDQAASVSWGDVTDVTDPLWPMVDGAPARNVTGRELTVGQQVRLITVARDRLVFGIDNIPDPPPDPEPPPPAGGGWELIWQAQSATNISAQNVTPYADWDALRLVVQFVGGPSSPVNQALVELGFGLGSQLTPATVALDDGQQYTVTLEAWRHLDDRWSGELRDLAPASAITGRGEVESLRVGTTTVPPGNVSVTAYPIGGSGGVDVRLWGVRRQET